MEIVIEILYVHIDVKLILVLFLENLLMQNQLFNIQQIVQ